MSPNGPFESGTLLGKYEILKRLATGGMAEIYLARVSGLPGIQKMVVVKRILPQFADKSDFVEMFLDEARIVATLEHPNVVQLYDVGVVDRNYFIAMEYLHGEDVRSLARTLSRAGRRLPLEHSLNILIGVAAGLHYAHEKVGFDGRPLSIVHRDVNPQNVIVTYNGSVKLLDFGIAKASNRLNETRMGTLKGKVPYMSPEQCRGEALDRRSDLFSLGIMLYELTVGRQLYPGKSDFEVLKQIVEGTVVPPRDIDPEYSPALQAIVMRALEKDKDKRYQTAREMQVDLEALVWQERLHVSPIALAEFMEELFVDKIDAWKQAQSRGESLGEHLQQTMPIAQAGHDDDEEPVIELTPADAERVAAERAAFRARVDAASLVSATSQAAQAQGVQSDAALVINRKSNGKWAALFGIGAALAGIGYVARDAIFGGSKPAGVAQPAQPVAARPETELAAPAIPSGMAERPKATVETRTVEAKAPEARPEPLAAPPDPAGPTEPTTAMARPAAASALKPLPKAEPKRLAGPPPGKHGVVAVKGKKVEPLTSVLPRPPRGLPAPPPVPAESPAPVRAAPAPTPPPAVTTQAPRAEPPPPRLDGEGTLMLASSPWCNVTVDGVTKGTTPLSVKLPAGKHTVVLTNSEFNIRRTLPVTIVPDETLRKRLDFAQ